MTDESTAALDRRAPIRIAVLLTMAVGIGIFWSASSAEADALDQVQKNARVKVARPDATKGTAASKRSENPNIAESADKLTSGPRKLSRHEGSRDRDAELSNVRRKVSEISTQRTKINNSGDREPSKINIKLPSKINKTGRDAGRRSDPVDLDGSRESAGRVVDKAQDAGKRTADAAGDVARRVSGGADPGLSRQAPGSEEPSDPIDADSDPIDAEVDKQTSRPADMIRQFPGRSDRPTGDKPADTPGTPSADQPDEPVGKPADKPSADKPSADKPSADKPAGGPVDDLPVHDEPATTDESRGHDKPAADADSPEADSDEAATDASDGSGASTVGGIIDGEVIEPVADIVDSVGTRPVGDVVDGVTDVDLAPSDAVPGLVDDVIEIVPDDVDPAVDQVIDPVINTTDPVLGAVDPVVDGAEPAIGAVQQIVGAAGSRVAEPVDPVAADVTHSISETISASGDGVEAGLPLPASPGLDAVGGGVGDVIEETGGAIDSGETDADVPDQILLPIVRPIVDPLLPQRDLPDLSTPLPRELDRHDKPSSDLPDAGQPIGSVPTDIRPDGATAAGRGFVRPFTPAASAAARDTAPSPAIEPDIELATDAPVSLSRPDGQAQSGVRGSAEGETSAHLPADDGSQGPSGSGTADWAANGCSASGSSGGPGQLAANQQLHQDFALHSDRVAPHRNDDATRDTAYDPGFSPD